MRTEEAPIAAELGPSGLEVLVSRQPVLDAAMRVTGYRVAYAARDGDDRTIFGDRSSTRLLGDVLSVIGLDELVGTTPAHLPLSRELLLALGIPPVRPDRAMLRISHDTAVDEQLHAVLDALVGRGYALALYGIPGPDFEPALLDMFGTVEVDFSLWSEEDAELVVPRILAGRATPLAAEVITRADFARAKELGFELFAGSFHASPSLTAVRKVPVAEMGTLVALAGLQGQSATIEELEQVIDRDVGLSVKLLRYINSAFIGMRGQINSIRQAVMMLGSRGVSRWALLVALTGAPSTPRELSVVGLTRARMCELLGADLPGIAGDELFTVGLLSVADALLEMPLETVVEELPLADGVVAALLDRDGPAGSILDAVVSYEQGEFDAKSLQEHRRGVAESYRDALGWAVETVTALA